ncbi:MAG: ATP-binding protein [Mycolicibacterium sp.]|uniref:ATP-binding protein n=1 Tax=Mycolicibacterium sp. TaxID=2320850 RepID=UPI003D0FF185
MHIYTSIRRAKKLVGTTGAGNPLFGGPYQITRDLPVAAIAVFLATSVAIAGFALGKITGLALGVLAAGAILYAGTRLIVRIRRLPEDVSVEDWIGARLDAVLARPTHLDGPNPFHPDTETTAGSKLLATKRIIHGNIRDVGGKFWAEYRIPDPLENGLVTDAQHSDVLAEHQLLLRELLRHGALISRFKEPVPATELIEDSFTVGDHDPEHIPQYAAAVVDMLDGFADKAAHDPSSWPSREVHSVTFYVGDNEAEAAARRDEILAGLPFTWRLTPATAAQMYWQWYAHCTRGAAFVDTSRTDIPETLPSVEVDDGARTDASLLRRFLRRPELTPILKVTAGDVVSYQAILTVVLPDVIDWPDTDFLSVFAHISAPIDVAIRCIPKDRAVVLEENQKADVTISDNQEETAHLKSRVAAFSREEQLLQIYSERMAANPEAHSVLFTIFVAVGGQTPAEVKALVESMGTAFARSGIRFREPRAGKQEELWAAMQPGAPRSRALVAVADETMIDEFAELIPFTTAAIGHRKGPIIARNLTSGLGDVVRLAADEVVQANRAASIGIVADVGAGKSGLGKVLAYYAHARSQSWGAIDRSNIEVSKNPSRRTGEWVKFAEPLNDTQIVDVSNPPGSMDPLKVWRHDPEEATRRAYGLLIELLRMNENQELALSEALDVTTLAQRKIDSMAALARYLMTRTDDPAAVMVGRKIRSWQRHRFAAAIFDEKLEPLRLSARGTVFRTHGLQLPDSSKVLNEHLYRKLLPEERYALALYPLLSAFLSAAFAERGEAGWIFIDEAWTVTRSPVGHELIEPQIRDARKHNIIPVFMTHAGGAELSDPIFQLITIRFVGRATDDDLALANLTWFKAMPIDQSVIDACRAMKNGRFYMAMMNDDGDAGTEGEGGQGVRQVAEVQVLWPNDPVIAEAMSTKPLRADRRRQEVAA